MLWQTVLCISIASCSTSPLEVDLRPWPELLKARSIADETVSEKFHLTKPIRAVFCRKVMNGQDGMATVIYFGKDSQHGREFAVVVNTKTWQVRYLP